MCQGNLLITNTPWLPTGPNFHPTSSLTIAINLKVGDLWWPSLKAWIEEMVRSTFIKEDVDKVIELWVPQ